MKPLFKYCGITGLFIALWAVCPSAALSAIRNVPLVYPNIQAAIDAAVAGDEVVIADGTYSGVGNINLDFGGKAITVRSANGAGAVIIDVGGAFGNRGVIFQSAETRASVLQGVTIQNGNADFGGGIRITQGFAATSPSPTIRECIIRNNTAGQGGGVNISGPDASPIFINVVISGNNATAVLNGQGGGGLRAARTDGTTTVTVVDSEIDSNTSAGSGGGILIDRATLRISHSTISNNSTFGYNGGGIAVSGLLDGDPTNGQYANAYIHNCILFGNSAWQKGGALRFNHILSTNTLEVVNTLILDNSSSTSAPPDGAGNGAAVDAWQASPVFINSTITENSDLAGNSILFAHTDGPPFLLLPVAITTVANSIVYDNIGGQLAQVLDGASSVLIGYSAIDDPVNYPAGVDGNINDDPQFVDAAAGDFRLAVTSPAIDAGNNALLPVDSLDLDEDGNSGELVSVDLDGASRFFNSPLADTGSGTAPIVDMGAFEIGNGAFQFGEKTYSVGESDTTVSIEVKRVGGGYGAISVQYDTADDTALAGSDYASDSDTLSWFDGETDTKIINLIIYNDSGVEPSESFYLNLSNPTGGALIGRPATTTVTIEDDDNGGGSGSGGGGGGGCFISTIIGFR